MREKFGRPPGVLPKESPKKRLESIPKEEYNFRQIIKEIYRSPWTRFLTGIVTIFTAGKIGTEAINFENRPSKDHTETEEVEITPGSFQELKKDIEKMRDIYKILKIESVYQLYKGTNQEEEFKELVDEEEVKQRKANTGGSQSDDSLERVYARGLENLAYLLKVANNMRVPKGILMGMALEESGFNKDKTNKRSSAKSEMQILDETARIWSKKFSVQLDSWIRDMEACGQDKNPLHVEEYNKLKELRGKLSRGEDLRTEDGLYLGAYGFRTLCKNRESIDSAILAYKIGNAGASRKVAEVRKEGEVGTYLDVRPKLKSREDQQYEIRVQVELNLFLQSLKRVIDRVDNQTNHVFNNESFFDPD